MILGERKKGLPQTNDKKWGERVSVKSNVSTQKNIVSPLASCPVAPKILAISSSELSVLIQEV